MDNNQFHIPLSEHSASPELIQNSESVFDSPETKESLGAFEYVKAIEQRIDTFRASATEANLPPETRIMKARKKVTNLFTVNSAPKSLHDELIEVESEIGGALLPTGPGVMSQRFWYQQNDWFYDVHDTAGSMVARYQFTYDSVIKLVDGRPTYLADGETEAIYKTIPLYYDAISELYSKDDFGLAA